MLVAAVVVEWYGQMQTGLRPQQTAYAAAVYMLISLQGFFVLIMLFMGIYTIARSLCWLLGPERRVTFENTMLFWYYTVAQGMIALALVHSFPRLVG